MGRDTQTSAADARGHLAKTPDSSAQPGGRTAIVKSIAKAGESVKILGLLALTQALMNGREIANARIETLRARVAELETALGTLTQQEAQARHLAHHDALTGLPNRTLLHDRVGQAMSHAQRHHASMALLLIDLDGFKRVNDRLGHDTGDRVLRGVAQRLVASVRAADTACRYGGDEFVVLLFEVESAAQAAAVADKVRAQLCKSHFIDGYRIRITASVGAALYPSDAETYDQLIRHADTGMYAAKIASGDPSIVAATDDSAMGFEMHEGALLPPSGYPSGLRRAG
jgi:diguanylate cyclase